MKESNRQFFRPGPNGDIQLKETLAALLVGLSISPQPLWLVSPWVSDFDLLDNRNGDWGNVNPSWGNRMVTFSELLVLAVRSGCELNLVTNTDEMNIRFYEKVKNSLGENDSFVWDSFETLHTKGLLSNSFFLSGSMNFTYSGTNRNDEQIQLTDNPDQLLEVRLEFQERYGRDD